jgi:hypothetical protein
MPMPPTTSRCEGRSGASGPSTSHVGVAWHLVAGTSGGAASRCGLFRAQAAPSRWRCRPAMRSGRFPHDPATITPPLDGAVWHPRHRRRRPLLCARGHRPLRRRRHRQEDPQGRGQHRGEGVGGWSRKALHACYAAGCAYGGHARTLGTRPATCVRPIGTPRCPRTDGDVGAFRPCPSPCAHAPLQILAYVNSVRGVGSNVDHSNFTLEDVESNIVRCPDQEAAVKMIDGECARGRATRFRALWKRHDD